MARQEYEEEALLKNIMGSFMDSYAGKDGNGDFAGWLGDKLRQELPDLSEEAGKRLAGEIIEAVAAYDKTLQELKSAVENGQSREGWFAERLLENCDGMSLSDTGSELLQIKEELTASNARLMKENGRGQTETGEETEEPVTEWNEYSIRDKAHEIGKQVALTGVAVAANVIQERLQNEDDADINGAVRETLKAGLMKEPVETKAVVAGAIRVAVEKGVKNIIPEDISEDDAADLIGSMAGTAVEGAEAMFDVATGKITMIETIDRIGMAAVASGGYMASRALKGWLASVPYVGPVLVDVAGGLLDHLHSPKFVRNAYKAIKDAAVDTWEGVKNSYTAAALRKVKNIIFG